MFRIIKKRIKFLIYRCLQRHNAKISLFCDVSKSSFEGKNSIAKGCTIRNCSFGFGSYVNNDSSLSFVKIGRYCSIADHVHVCLGNHPTHFVSTFPAFYYDTTSQIGFTFHKGEPIYNGIYKYPINENYYQIVIGNDVWIGSHVIIMGGVKIGDGAIIAAGAVVTKDVKPYSIVGGVPAKYIKMRFSNDIIDQLLFHKWWNNNFEEISKNYKYFIDLDTFFKNYVKNNN